MIRLEIVLKLNRISRSCNENVQSYNRGTECEEAVSGARISDLYMAEKQFPA